MAVAGLVLGIVAIVISFFSCGVPIGVAPALVGIVLSVLGLKKAKQTGEGKGMSMAGLVLSIIALVFSLIWFFVLAAALTAAAGAAAEAAEAGAL